MEILLPLAQAAQGVTDDRLRSIALGVGAGLGSIGAGIGTFYTFIFGLIAFFLSAEEIG
jgi:hypothetical protein